MVEISITIPTLNEEKMLPRLLSSLKAQKNAPDFEIIVIDAGSTDKTREIAEKEGCRVILESSTLGAQRQKGLEAASGKYIVFTDADCVADQFWLKELYNYIGDCTIGSIRMLESKTIVGKAMAEMISLSETKDDSRVQQFPAVNVLIKTEAARRIGFDTKMPTSEDGDFSYRFIKSGYLVRYCSRAIMFHKYPDTICSLYKREVGIGIAKKVMLRKYPKWWMLNNIIKEMLYPISPLFWYRVIFNKKAKHKALILYMGLIAFFARFISLFKQIPSAHELKKRFYSNASVV